jgi:hypothetical protein
MVAQTKELAKIVAALQTPSAAAAIESAAPAGTTQAAARTRVLSRTPVEDLFGDSGDGQRLRTFHRAFSSALRVCDGRSTGPHSWQTRRLTTPSRRWPSCR